MMESYTKTWVCQLEPGAFYPEEYDYEVQSRDPLKVKVRPRAFCFYFYDMTYAEVDGERLAGRSKNQSGCFYIGGEIFEGEAIPEYGYLAENARANGWKRLIRCRTGNWQPLEDGDVVIPEDSFQVMDTSTEE